MIEINFVVPKVHNLESPRSGKPVANQFVIKMQGSFGAEDYHFDVFQSYDTVIAVIDYTKYPREVKLDKDDWNYSTTTSKYRNIFLGETTKETKAKIASGEYILADLNK